MTEGILAKVGAGDHPEDVFGQTRVLHMKKDAFGSSSDLFLMKDWKIRDMESKKRESLRNKHEDHYLPGKADTCAGFHPDNFEDRVQQYLSAVIPGMLHNKT